MIVFATGFEHGPESSVLPPQIFNKIYDPRITPKKKLLYLE